MKSHNNREKLDLYLRGDLETRASLDSLFNYTVISEKAKKKFKKEIERIKKERKGKHELTTVMEEENRLAKDSEVRRRYRFEEEGIVRYAEPDVSIAVALYMQGLKDAGRGRLILAYELDWLFYDYDLLKEFSDVSFRCGEFFDPDWRYMVHLTRLRDFRPSLKFEELLQLGKEWVTPKVHTWDGDEERFYKEFTLAVTNVIFEKENQVESNKTAEDWLMERVNWGGPGSSFSDEGDIDKEYKKTKWNFAWNASDSQLRHLFWRKRKQRAKLFVKREPTKARGVVGSDMMTYLRMKYISDVFLTKYFSADMRSTLWMTGTQRMTFWENLTEFKGWRMPLDQSSFDQMQSLRMVKITLKVLRQCALKNLVGGARKDVDAVFEMLEYSLDGGEMLVQEGDEKAHLEIKNGILSGWFWTALLDTILNLAVFQMARKWVAESGHITKLYSMCAQGDDDQMEFKNKEDCIFLYLAYEAFGFLVNPSKFYISRTRDEFLRKSITPGAVDGYPARSILSILWRNPVGDEDAVGRQRLDSCLMRWKLYSDRLGIELQVKKMMQDMTGSVKGISRDVIINWVRTPRSYGGGGYRVSSNWVSISDSIEVNKDVASTRGMAWLVDRFGNEGKFGKFVETTLTKKKKKEFTGVEFKKLSYELPEKISFSGKYKYPKLKWISGSPIIYSILEDTEYIKENTANWQSYLSWYEGFSHSVQKCIDSDDLVTGPFMMGYSIEYVSLKVKQVAGRLLQRLRNSQGGVGLLKRMRLYLELNFMAISGAFLTKLRRIRE